MDANDWRSEREASRPSVPIDGCHGRRSNNTRRADAANDCERMLLRSIAAGDVAALSGIHSRFHRRILGFARAITGRSDLAEEIANDTLWVIWQSAGRFRGAAKVSTWILGIAYRLSLKTLETISRRLPRRIASNPRTSPEQRPRFVNG